jgi:hypothetical protein
VEKVERHDGIVSVFKPYIGKIEVLHGQVESIERPPSAHECEAENEDDGPGPDKRLGPLENDIALHCGQTEVGCQTQDAGREKQPTISSNSVLKPVIGIDDVAQYEE